MTCNHAERQDADLVSPEEPRIKKNGVASSARARDESSREVKEEALIFLARPTGTACRHGITVDLSLATTFVGKLLMEEDAGRTDRLCELDSFAIRQHKESKDEVSPLL